MMSLSKVLELGYGVGNWTLGNCWAFSQISNELGFGNFGVCG